MGRADAERVHHDGADVCFPPSGGARAGSEARRPGAGPGDRAGRLQTRHHWLDRRRDDLRGRVELQPPSHGPWFLCRGVGRAEAGAGAARCWPMWQISGSWLRWPHGWKRCGRPHVGSGSKPRWRWACTPTPFPRSTVWLRSIPCGSSCRRSASRRSIAVVASPTLWLPIASCGTVSVRSWGSSPARLCSSCIRPC